MTYAACFDRSPSTSSSKGSPRRRKTAFNAILCDLGLPVKNEKYVTAEGGRRA